MQTDNRANIGQIQGKDLNGRMGPTWTYRPTDSEWAKELGFDHEVDTIAGPRYARILETRMHMLTDEDGNYTVIPFKYNMKY